MSGYKIKKDGVQVSRDVQSDRAHGKNILNGMFVGKVVNNKDSLYLNRLQVHFPDFGAESAPLNCLLASPFGGYNEILDSGNDEENASVAPSTYGMWQQPPEVGTNVVVMFTPTIEQGVVLGSIWQKDRNSMLGGKASNNAYLDGEQTLAPTVEKNPYDTNDSDTKPTDASALKYLIEQGLYEDFVRGHSMSSARRESPSNVFGITTKGGHVLSMDDGDENGDSKNIRMRTAGGAQVLIEDTNEFIFITNHKGNAWVEMDKDGRIDFYSSSGVSFATDKDFNIHAKGSINMQAEQGVNIKSSGSDGIKIESSVGNIDTYSALNTNIQSDANYNLKIAGNSIHTAARIDMNGPAASSAEKTKVNNQEGNTGVQTSASSRVPEKHPWAGATSTQEDFSTGKGNTA